MDQWVPLQQAARVSGRDRKDLHRSIIEGDLPAIPLDDDRLYLVRLDDITPALRVFHETEPEAPPRRGRRLLWPVVILSILGVIAALVLPGLGRDTHAPKRANAHAQIFALKSAAEAFWFDHFRYPTGFQELLTGLYRPYIHPEILTDPWGNPIVYRVPGTAGRPFEIVSHGPDGVPSDDDIIHRGRDLDRRY